MEFIIKNNLDYVARYCLGSIFLILSVLFLFVPQSKDVFEIFELTETTRLLLGYGVFIVALLFIIDCTRLWGAVGLLISFVFTAYFHIRVGLNPWGLSIWIAGVVFVLFSEQYRMKIVDV